MVVVNISADITMNMQQLQHERATRSIDFETIIVRTKFEPIEETVRVVVLTSLLS